MNEKNVSSLTGNTRAPVVHVDSVHISVGDLDTLRVRLYKDAPIHQSIQTRTESRQVALNESEDDRHRNNENKTHICNCKEVEKKLISLLKDNGKLLQMIRDLRKENERLTGELGGRADSAVPGSQPVRTGDNDNNAEVRSLIEINHGWKRDYEELQMRYEMLSGGKRSLEEEEKELKERIGDQGPLESEITRQAAYKENFERERRDREKIDEENEKMKRELESAEEIIKMLTTQFDVVCREIEEYTIVTRDENRALEERPALPIQVRHQPGQLVQPFVTGMASL